MLVKSGIGVPVLCVENAVLATDFGKRSRKFTQQALVEFTTDGEFIISLHLANESIIGCQFLKEYDININFER
jgi:hypothetical protein